MAKRTQKKQRKAPPVKENGLTARQKLFVAEYLVDLNATQAATRAGYSAKVARQQGAENLSKPVIQEAIAQAMAERITRVEVKADDVVRELARIGFSDLAGMFKGGELLKLEEAPEDMRRAVSSIEVVTRKAGHGAVERVTKIRAWDKVNALTSLGRHLGLFAADNEKNVNLSGRLTIEDEKKRIEAETAQLTQAEIDEQAAEAERFLAKVKRQTAAAVVGAEAASAGD